MADTFALFFGRLVNQADADVNFEGTPLASRYFAAEFYMTAGDATAMTPEGFAALWLQKNIPPEAFPGRTDDTRLLVSTVEVCPLGEQTFMSPARFRWVSDAEILFTPPTPWKLEHAIELDRFSMRPYQAYYEGKKLRIWKDNPKAEWFYGKLREFARAGWTIPEFWTKTGKIRLSARKDLTRIGIMESIDRIVGDDFSSISFSRPAVYLKLKFPKGL